MRSRIATPMPRVFAPDSSRADVDHDKLTTHAARE
jgi:hypothetical protein